MEMKLQLQTEESQKRQQQPLVKLAQSQQQGKQLLEERSRWLQSKDQPPVAANRAEHVWLAAVKVRSERLRLLLPRRLNALDAGRGCLAVALVEARLQAEAAVALRRARSLMRRIDRECESKVDDNGEERRGGQSTMASERGGRRTKRPATVEPPSAAPQQRRQDDRRSVQCGASKRLQRAALRQGDAALARACGGEAL